LYILTHPPCQQPFYHPKAGFYAQCWLS